MTHLRERRHCSLYVTNELTGKSPDIAVLQMSYSGSVVLATCRNSTLPGAQEKEMVQNRLMPYYHMLSVFPPSTFACAQEQFLPKWNIWRNVSDRLRTGNIPFILQNPKHLSEAVRREGGRGGKREGNRGKIFLIPVRWRRVGGEKNILFLYHYFKKEINERRKRRWREYGKRMKWQLFY